MSRKLKKYFKNIFAHIILFSACIVAIYPVLWILKSALSAKNSLFNLSLSVIPSNPTLNNFKVILFQDNFLIWLKNSFLVTISTTVFSLIMASVAAYAYSRFSFKGRNMALGMFLVLNAFPNVLAMVAIYRLFSLLRLVNKPLGLILIYTSWQLVFAIWNLKGYFDTIPKEIEEAAYIDGVSRASIFTKIILPLSAPALAVTTLFAFLGSWNEYIFGVTFITSKKYYTLPMGLYYLQEKTGKYTENWGVFAAGSLLVAVPVSILFLYLQKYLTSGLMKGGVKG